MLSPLPIPDQTGPGDRQALAEWLRDRRMSATVQLGPLAEGEISLLDPITDLVFHVALGRNWFGRDVKRMPILYLAYEGERGLIPVSLLFDLWSDPHDPRV